MEASATASWGEFFVAAAGAAAALAGLVFVTLSINLARIINSPGVPGRAAEAIILLAGSLAASLAALVPHVSAGQLAGLLLAVTLPTWLVPVAIQIKTFKLGAYQSTSLAILRTVLHQVAALPGVLSGLALLGLLPGGIGWLALGTVSSMLVAVFSAWVLLVEILR